MSEWESPIHVTQKDIELTLENEVLTAIHRVGIDIDKEELVKALTYDRDQYFKGYKDAKKEIIHCKNCKHYHEEECPMRFVEWVTWEEDGYIESDDVVHDYATDDGFCYMGDRREE